MNKINLNEDKAVSVITKFNMKNAKKIIVGNEECILIDCEQKYIDKLQKQGLNINGHFSKNGFVLCNLHNLY